MGFFTIAEKVIITIKEDHTQKGNIHRKIGIEECVRRSSRRRTFWLLSGD